MKFLCDRDAIKDALACVSGRTKSGPDIPILSHILFEASGSSVKLTGHNLDSCSQATIAAEVDAKGAVAIPADRLVRLVAGLPQGGQIVVAADDKVVKVKAGRSIYQFGFLPAVDFPEPLTPRDPAELTLSPAQVRRLFEMPSPAVEVTETRVYLAGIFLHVHDKRLAACATNGHILIRALADATAAHFAGVIVPASACDEIVRLVGKDDAQFEIATNLLAVTVGQRHFVTKLIDATYPDFQRVIPQSAATPMTFDAKELDAALARLIAACDKEKSPIVRLAWDNKTEHVVASVRSDSANGEEHVECDSKARNASETAAQVEYLRLLIDGLGGERVRFLVDGPGEPIRIENPDDHDIVAVCMPCRY